MENSNTELSFIRPSLLSKDTGIHAWFSLKNTAYHADDSQIVGLNLGFNTGDNAKAVELNRKKLLSDLHLDANWIAYADQVHSSRVQVVSAGGTYRATDGLVTNLPGLTLAIQVADCAAVLIWDAEQHVIGAFHAGWRGAAAGILSQGIKLMRQQGASIKDAKAFISPCISQSKFEVGPEVAEHFPEEFVETQRYVKPHVDLKGVLSQQLTTQGMNREHIEVSRACTVSNKQDFYSFRREGEQSGRMMTLIRADR